MKLTQSSLAFKTLLVKKPFDLGRVFGKQLINCIALSQVIDSVTDLEFTVPDLLQGKEYLFKVCACNKCGPGEPAYVDEPVNMSVPASEYILDNFLPNLLLPVFVIFYLFIFWPHLCGLWD